MQDYICPPWAVMARIYYHYNPLAVWIPARYPRRSFLQRSGIKELKRQWIPGEIFSSISSSGHKLLGEDWRVSYLDGQIRINSALLITWGKGFSSDPITDGRSSGSVSCARNKGEEVWETTPETLPLEQNVTGLPKQFVRTRILVFPLISFFL